MRITGCGVRGSPADETVAVTLLRRAVDNGVDFIVSAGELTRAQPPSR